MQMLVTGGAGFIGSHLVERMLRDGHTITVVLKPGESEVNLAGLDVRKLSCDLLDRAALSKACAGADIVFHLAARTDLEGSSLSDYDVNIQGTENVVAAAEANGVKRIVFFSSMLAVPLTGRVDAIDEKFAALPTDMYGRSKREGERLVSSGRTPWTIIRPTLVFGPREFSTMRAFFQAVKRRHFMLIGGDVLQSFVYVKNLVEATYLAALSSHAENQLFFISDDRPYTLAEFASASAKALGVTLRPIRLPRPFAMLVAGLLAVCQRGLGVRVPLTPSRVRTMTTHYVYSIEKARRLFGYRPPYDLVAATEETANWYLERRAL